MRIKHLDLKAFGPFTDRAIEFASAQPGFHIIYGANEAGKSSSLRALKALLYGFPERTSDNFIHANDQLFVGGCLQSDDGRELTLYRRKKRKADLLDSEGNPLSSTALSNLLNGIESPLFESLYGIDHKTLIAGGEDILAQKGEAGQALFSAGMGIASLKKIMDSLEEEANDLFKDRGSKQKISQALREYKELKKELKNAVLLPGKWREHKKSHDDVVAHHADLEKESQSKSSEVSLLARLNKAIPELAKLENLEAQQRELGEVVLLPADFSEKVREVQQGMRETKLQIAKDQASLEKLQKKKEEIPLRMEILDHAESIEDLHQRLDRYRKDQRDRIKLDGERTASRRDAGALLEEVKSGLPLSEADSLRPLLVRKKTVQKLSSSYEAFNQKTVSARKAKEEAENELMITSEALKKCPTPRESDGLDKAITLARKAGDIDAHIAETATEVTAGYARSQAELKALGLWSGSLEELLVLPLPLVETVRMHEKYFDDLEKERAQQKKDLNRAHDDLRAADTEMKEIAYGGEVPTEQELEVSRHKRQKGWELLKRKWFEGEDISREREEYAPGKKLHIAYEKHVTQSDLVADRLRREAERVTKTASLQARSESAKEAIAELLRQQSDLHAREEGLRAQWHKVWEASGITPLSPAEMRAWLTDIDTIRFKVSEIRAKDKEREQKEKQRQHYCESLSAEINKAGEKFEYSDQALASVLVVAESLAEDIKKDRGEMEKLVDKKKLATTALKKAEKEQKEAHAEIMEWRQQWNEVLSVLGYSDVISTAEALDIIDTLSECFKKLEKAKEFQSRIDGIDRDVGSFTDDVQNVVGRAAADLEGLLPDQAVLELQSRHKKAQQDVDRLNELGGAIEGLVDEIDSGEKARQSLDAQMAEFFEIVQCENVSELTDCIARSEEYQRLNEKISEAESTLAKMSEGISRQEIKRQAGEIDVDEIPGRIEVLYREINEDLSPRIQEALKQIGQEKQVLKLMDGRGKAAEIAEKMEQLAAKIHFLVDQYTKIKLASKVLRDEIERYREEHQDPILKIASKSFEKLTLGSFSGLRTDVDDNGNPMLVGVRPDGARVSVNGMSDGTCDQLYLALRLATLESRLELHESMPFIVDDILINFDDERSIATLSMLAELSDKNQVILFTHHGRVIEEARKLQTESEIVVHEL